MLSNLHDCHFRMIGVNTCQISRGLNLILARYKSSSDLFEDHFVKLSAIVLFKEDSPKIYKSGIPISPNEWRWRSNYFRDYFNKVNHGDVIKSGKRKDRKRKLPGDKKLE